MAASEREPQALTVRFDDDVDLDLLLETVEVERGCCTFFDLAPDVERRELVVSVADRERVPALDAIATGRLAVVPEEVGSSGPPWRLEVSDATSPKEDTG